MTGVDTQDTRFERPCGRNVDGTAQDMSRRDILPSVSRCVIVRVGTG
jgi:hypothetical protein